MPISFRTARTIGRRRSEAYSRWQILETVLLALFLPVTTLSTSAMRARTATGTRATSRQLRPVIQSTICTARSRLGTPIRRRSRDARGPLNIFKSLILSLRDRRRHPWNIVPLRVYERGSGGFGRCDGCRRRSRRRERDIESGSCGAAPLLFLGSRLSACRSGSGFTPLADRSSYVSSFPFCVSNLVLVLCANE
jgi:hypothetical protein